MECEYITLRESFISTNNNMHYINSSFVVSISELITHVILRSLHFSNWHTSCLSTNWLNKSPLMEGYIMAHDRMTRSEERRVGKSVDLGGRRIIKKKKEKIR